MCKLTCSKVYREGQFLVNPLPDYLLTRTLMLRPARLLARYYYANHNIVTFLLPGSTKKREDFTAADDPYKLKWNTCSLVLWPKVISHGI